MTDEVGVDGYPCRQRIPNNNDNIYTSLRGWGNLTRTVTDEVGVDGYPCRQRIPNNNDNINYRDNLRGIVLCVSHDRKQVMII